MLLRSDSLVERNDIISHAFHSIISNTTYYRYMTVFALVPCCRYGNTVVAYSAGTNPGNVSLALVNRYGKQFDTPLVKTVNVNQLSEYKYNPSVHEYLLNVMQKDGGYAYIHSYMVAAQFEHDTATDEVRAIVFYNYEAYHTAPISLSLVDNTLLKHFVGAEYSIETQNHPVKPIYSEKVKEDIRVENMIYHRRRALAVYLSMLSLTITMYAIYLIDERTSDTKHLQMNTQLHPITFWVATFVSDLMVYIPSVIGIYFAFVVGDLPCYIEGANLVYSALFFLAYSVAALPFSYLVSLALSKDGIGMSLYLLFTLVGKQSHLSIS